MKHGFSRMKSICVSSVFHPLLLALAWMLNSPKAWLFATLALAAGCGDVPLPSSQRTAQSPAKPARPMVQPKQPVAASQRSATAERKPTAHIVRNSTAAVPSASRSIGRAEELAVKKITTVINQSLELGPTLVVWILDRTPSAQEMVADVAAAAANYYQSSEVREISAGENHPLLTAMVGFDDQVEFLVDPPTSDVQRALAAFDALRPSSSNREMPFTATKQALEKYLPLRTAQRREIVLVVVTDEAGDDAKIVDELVEPLRKNAIPVYVIGLPAPWGQVNPLAANPKAVEPAKDDSIPTLGPESLLSERVDLDNWNARYTNTSLVDSGFGPFALERLCRASRGQFIALRPGLGFGYRGVSARTWPTGDELRFEDNVASKYAPDYVSEAGYRKLLAENKARAALCEAARQPKVAVEGTPGAHFPKGAEAKMAKQFSAAQQFAARNLPPIDGLYSVLIKGESDRPKLTSPRWQAEFDLALGRVLANKARLDGYNSMIAVLKRGKTFQKPESKEWVLEPADNFETESTIKKMAEKAKTYLDRVVQEHPGTPWAKIAEEELKTPLGWTWKEA
jgi:hypothetical protein